MAITFDSYLGRVLPHVPGCPYPTAIEKIRDAAVEFCERTRIWREDLPAVDIVAATKEYTLTPASAARVVAPITVHVDGDPVDPSTEEELDLEFDNWRTDGISGYYTVPVPNKVRLTWSPDANIVGGLVVRAILKPGQAATEAGDILYDDWAEAIARGALHRIMEIPAKAWSNPQLATLRKAEFEGDIGDAALKVDKGHTRKRSRVRAHFM